MNAFVVGGGIAGLAAAKGLLRAGWTVTVAERQAAISEIGAGLVITRNGMTALAALGLDDEVRAVGHPVAITGQRDHRGRWLMRQPRDDPRFASLTRVTGVHRKRLLSVLERGVRDGAARILLGASVSKVRPGDPTGARAEVDWIDESGDHQRDAADLVVIADGVGSKIRNQLVPGTKIVYSGKTCWRAVINDNKIVDDDFVQAWGPHMEFGAVRIGRDEVYWYGYFVAPAQTSFDHEHAAAVAHFAGWPTFEREIVAATRPEQLMRHDVIHLPRGAPTYAVGRAVLAGDAAHALVPTMGQGANLSLEDGVSIGFLIGDPVRLGEPLDRAIANYDRTRRPRARRIARRSELAGRIGADLGPGLPQLIRNTALRLVPTKIIVGANAGALGWMQAGDRASATLRRRQSWWTS